MIRGWITGGLEALRQLGTLVGTVGGILFHVFSVANSVGGGTLQMLNGIVGAVYRWLQSAEGMHFLVTVFTAVRDTVNALMPGVSALWGALADLAVRIAPMLPLVGHAFSAIATALAPVIGWLGNLVTVIIPPLMNFAITYPGLILGVAGAFFAVAGAIRFAQFAMSVYNGIMTAYRVATAIATGVTWLWNAALRANPIGLVITGLMLLVGAIIYAWNNFSWFRNGVLAVWNFLKSVAAWVTGAFVAAWNGLSSTIATVWAAIKFWVVSTWTYVGVWL